MRFRTKPCEIEAVQFTGSNHEVIFAFCPEANRYNRRGEEGPQDHVFIRTLEGEHIASPNDWIVKGLEGEFYPVKPSIFAMKYEPVPSPEPAREEPRE